MDCHMDLWSLLGSNGVSTPAQFAALVDAASVRLGLEESATSAEAMAAAAADSGRPPAVRLYTLKEIKHALFDRSG